MNIKTPFKLYWIHEGTIYEAYSYDDNTYGINSSRGNLHLYGKSDIHDLITEGVIVIVEDPLVTIKQSEYDDLISEINALQELVRELSAPQDSALEQQAETYRALNETLTRHDSFQEGEDGASTTRCEELLNTIDFLHEVYDDWKTNDYRAAVASAGSDAFKPISEYTLEDWELACKEDWIFNCRNGYNIRIMGTFTDGDYVVRGDDDLTRTISGQWSIGYTDGCDIVKRVQ